MYKKMLLVLCAMLLAVSAQAGTNVWIGGALGDFNNVANWSLGTVPGSGDDLVTTKVDSDFSAEALAAYAVADASASATDWATFTGLAPSPLGWTNQVINTWATDGDLTIGRLQTGQGKASKATINIRTNIHFTGEVALSCDSSDYTCTTVNQYSGNVDSSDSIRIPQRYNGEWNIYGGTLTCNDIRLPRKGSGWADPANALATTVTLDGQQAKDFAKSRLNIYGGTVYDYAASFSFGVADATRGDFGIINMNGGSLVMAGDQITSGLVDWAISSGHLVANNGAGTVVAVFDGVNTIVTPEPATMAMLAIGALGLIRRKK